MTTTTLDAAAPTSRELKPPQLNLSSFDLIVVNSSGGKDSQTALRRVVMMADSQGVPRSRIIVSHQCLGEMEWNGTRELAELQAAHYGLRFEVTRYRNMHGGEDSLLDVAERRSRWPDSANRYCTSEFKRGPGGRLLTAAGRELETRGARILNVYGFRADESPARAKKKPIAVNARFSSRAREVVDWLPIFRMTEAEVWADIRSSGVPYHYAYDLGMPRLSCVFCIFAPRQALLTAGRHNRALLDRYVAAEARMGHTFQAGLSLGEIRDAIESEVAS